jgi:hypothetical protein
VTTTHSSPEDPQADASEYAGHEEVGDDEHAVSRVERGLVLAVNCPGLGGAVPHGLTLPNSATVPGGRGRLAVASFRLILGGRPALDRGLQR